MITMKQIPFSCDHDQIHEIAHQESNAVANRRSFIICTIIILGQINANWRTIGDARFTFFPKLKIGIR